MSDVATEENRQDFWDRLKACRTGMFEAEGKFVPMTHNLDPEDGNIWFLTAEGTSVTDAAQAGETIRYIVSNDGEALYTVIEGTLSISTNREKLDEVWSTFASAWYEDGKDDPDLVLVRLAPKAAEVWLGPKSGMKFLWGVAKAKITGEEPDYGSHFTLSLGAQTSL